MIPQTVGALIGFLLFVAPGVSWELLRERYRPPLEGSAFREAARVALMSVVLSGAATCVLALVHAVAPAVFLDPGRWLRDGSGYVSDHYQRIAVTIGAEVALACTFAWLPWRWPKPFARVIRKLLPPHPKSGGPNVTEPALWSVLFGTAAGATDSIIALDKLETTVVTRHVDGHSYIGKFLALDYTLGRDDAYLALQSPIRVRRPGDAGEQLMPGGYDRVVLPLAELADLWVIREEPAPEAPNDPPKVEGHDPTR